MELEQRLRLIVMGASAGAIETLSEILPALPKTFPLPIVIVIHLPQTQPSMLPKLFQARCQLPVKEVEDKERLRRGAIYFAPPGYHVLVEREGTLSLDCDAPVHFSRPSIDVLFETAASALGSSVLGVLLTGASQDGARGLALIKAAGGIAVVQDPGTAGASLMPAGGIAAAKPDHVLSPRKICELLLGFATQSHD